MKHRFILNLVLSLVLSFVFATRANSQKSVSPTPPEKFFGFSPGTDKELATYEKLIDYLLLLEKESDRIKMEKIGESPKGKAMYCCLISDAENLNNIDELKQINRELALNPLLTESDKQKYISKGKVFVLGTLSMHSTEVGPSQAAAQIAWIYATSNETERLFELKNTVYMMIPCHNPDGMDMIVNHYYKYRNTALEGVAMPGVYHKYVGHDNNRDFVTLSQSDTKAISKLTSQDWFPQVMVEKHQMWQSSTRYFVPPPHDPIAENIPSGLWNWMSVFGSKMITDMTADGCSGVSQHYLFDDYWPSSTETSLWKGCISMLTECASADLASPIYIEENELVARGKGLSEYEKSINMPEPWPGGWWRLSDIIHYEISSTQSILNTAAKYRADILAFRNNFCHEEVLRGESQAPFYYHIPAKQKDKGETANLILLLLEHGVNVFSLNKDFNQGNQVFHQGDYFVPMNQAFRPFIKEVLESQEFPVRHYTPDGELIKPYDITSWSLPLHRGVACSEINTKIPGIETFLNSLNRDDMLKSLTIQDTDQAILLPSDNNSSYKVVFELLAQNKKVLQIKNPVQIKEKIYPAGSFYLKHIKLNEEQSSLPGLELVAVPDDLHPDVRELKQPRIGLVETWFHDMDAGWARYVFDQYHIAYSVLHPDEIKKFKPGDFDVLIFPNSSKDILMFGKNKSGDGYAPSNYPPEYTKGMEKEGFAKLGEFISNGGIILSWEGSSALFEQNFTTALSKELSFEYKLPFRNIAGKLKQKGLYCPGSLVQIELNTESPITYGLPETIPVFYRANQAFQTSIPKFDMDRRVIAKFPDKNILASGYCEHEELLKGIPAVVWVKKGKGQLVLMAFNPQFRASTQVSFKLLFNGILLEKLSE